MQAKLIMWLVEMLLGFLSAERLKEFADMLLDFVENYVTGSKSTVDDALVLPLCGKIREAFDIPDDD